MERRKIDKAIWTTLTGVASGAIIGLLFAPDKGTTTRKKLSKQGDKYLKKVRNDIKELRKSLDKIAGETKAEIDELRRNAKSRGNDIAKEAKKIASYDEWTKEELYEEAKQAKIDGYSQMSKDELITALKKN
jgi:gas vesicle protein